MKEYNQTLYVVWGNHLLFILFMCLYFEWWMILAAILNIHIFGMFSEVSIHRYFTHKSFETTRWKQHILKIWAFLAGQGAVLSWVTVHRHHHAYEDQPGDPHSPFFIPWWKIYLGLFTNNYKRTLVTDLLRSKDKNYFIFENKNYWKMWTSLWIISFLIHPYLFFFFVSGAAMWYWATSIVNILSHGEKVGTKKDLKIVATNSNLLNLITGIGNHHNHHRFPKNYSYSTGPEIDLNSKVIEYFFKD
jgi:stearoyl-CoA desaturase (delta-9 desaturase)